MWGFQRKLPVSPEEQAWVDSGMQRLETLLGRDRMLESVVVLADDRCFPDSYEPTKAGAVAMAHRIAGYMGVRTDVFEVHMYAEGEEAFKSSVPLWSAREESDAAGLFFHVPEDGRFKIGVHAKQLEEPDALAATLAHELAHVLLLGGGLMAPEEPDMEPFTDLATVYLGLGVMTSGAAYRFSQWSNNQYQGWSTNRMGYLTERLWGYALARFAHTRGERKPAWRAALTHTIRVYFDQSARWLERSATK